MDAGKAVSMTTEQETIGWATSLRQWWRSSASAQVGVHSYVCVCQCVGVGVTFEMKLTFWMKCQGHWKYVRHIWTKHRRRTWRNTEKEVDEDEVSDMSIIRFVD